MIFDTQSIGNFAKICLGTALTAHIHTLAQHIPHAHAQHTQRHIEEHAHRRTRTHTSTTQAHCLYHKQKNKKTKHIYIYIYIYIWIPLQSKCEAYYTGDLPDVTLNTDLRQSMWSGIIKGSMLEMFRGSCEHHVKVVRKPEQ